MEFSMAGSHMIMQSFEPNGEIFGYQPQNPNPSNDHWQVDGFSLSLSKPMTSSSHHQEQIFMDDGSGGLHLFQSSHHQRQQEQPFVLKRSKHLVPAQELLNEFCSLGGIDNSIGPKKKEHKENCKWGNEGGPSSTSALDLVELQKRKAKLLFMLEEVYRRYRRYCDQMRAVVSSFEVTAGEGSARVYSTQASKAMSRHFRCLKDGIMRQIQETKMAMGEKDAVAPGTTKGETPRLKKLEQCFRQQKAFHQAGIMEPWRPQRGLPEISATVLRAWLFEHFLHPYPSDVDKHILARQAGLSRTQVSNWFINARVRLWKPMVEEMYLEELKEEKNSKPNDASSSQPHGEEQKPMPSLLVADSDSLSFIVNSNHHLNPNPNFGAADMDFSAYNGGTAGVSLTLGLQHQEQSLFFSRHHIDEDRAVQFSILDDEGQKPSTLQELDGWSIVS